ncbi:MAG: flavin reductase [Deltaproteobacteria bacterium]|nr:MAG: flavin reductase [Deltaproteobacteria bacterium]
MLVLGLQGSPRKKGNTRFLLDRFLEASAGIGARTVMVDASRRNILPCRELTACERKGFCPLRDDMEDDIYALITEADVIVVATPVFFYNMTAQLKALIDRCQVFWARKYRFKLKEPGIAQRKGFLLSVGASRGKQLFEAIELSTRYFFDAVSAEYGGSLTYRGVENVGDLAVHKTVEKEVEKAVERIVKPLTMRKRIIFACRENACRSQMAAAFARYLGGDKIDAISAGSKPVEKVNPVMQAVMAEKGIDLAFARPRSLDKTIDVHRPEMIVTMGCESACPNIEGVETINWDLPDPAGQSKPVMQEVCTEIEKRIRVLTQQNK